MPDEIDQFETECCDPEPGVVKCADLYSAFRWWWIKNVGSEPMRRLRFGRIVEARGWQKRRRNGGYIYLGPRTLRTDYRTRKQE